MGFLRREHRYLCRRIVHNFPSWHYRHCVMVHFRDGVTRVARLRQSAPVVIRSIQQVHRVERNHIDRHPATPEIWSCRPSSGRSGNGEQAKRTGTARFLRTPPESTQGHATRPSRLRCQSRPRDISPHLPLRARLANEQPLAPRRGRYLFASRYRPELVAAATAAGHAGEIGGDGHASSSSSSATSPVGTSKSITSVSPSASFFAFDTLR